MISKERNFFVYRYRTFVLEIYIELCYSKHRTNVRLRLREFYLIRSIYGSCYEMG